MTPKTLYQKIWDCHVAHVNVDGTLNLGGVAFEVQATVRQNAIIEQLVVDDAEPSIDPIAVRGDGSKLRVPPFTKQRAVVPEPRQDLIPISQ